MMNLKTILFKLKLRKLRDGDVVLVKKEGKLKCFKVIGNKFDVKIDEYNKQNAKTRGRVAVLSSCYLGYNFTVIETKDVKEFF